MESRSDLIKEMSKLRLRTDPDLPRVLSWEQKKAAYQKSDLQTAISHQHELHLQLKDKYRLIKDAPPECPDFRQHRKLSVSIRGLKLRYEREAFSTLLKNFHSNADLEHMVLQLQGKQPMSTGMLAPVQHSLPDRIWLADHLFAPANDEGFVEIVEKLSRLCSSIEPLPNINKSKRKTVSKKIQITGAATIEASDTQEQQFESSKRKMDAVMDDIPPPVSLDVEETSTLCEATDTPANKRSKLAATHICTFTSQKPALSQSQGSKLSTDIKAGGMSRKAQSIHNLVLPRNVCLFCYKPGIKNHKFPRKDHLRRPYRCVHFQYQVGAFWCPVPDCNTLIHDINQFANHATTVHRSDIGIRASIMEAKSHVVKPGQLQTFRLS